MLTRVTVEDAIVREFCADIWRGLAERSEARERHLYELKDRQVLRGKKEDRMMLRAENSLQNRPSVPTVGGEITKPALIGSDVVLRRRGGKLLESAGSYVGQERNVHTPRHSIRPTVFQRCPSGPVKACYG